MLAQFYFALMLTLSVESWVYRWLKPQDGWYLLTIMVMNVVLNPLMNESLMVSGFTSYYPMLIILEVMVIITETIILKLLTKTDWKQAFVFALIANVASLGLGLWFHQFGLSEATLWVGASVLTLPLLVLWSTWFFHQILIKQCAKK